MLAFSKDNHKEFKCHLNDARNSFYFSSFQTLFLYTKLSLVKVDLKFKEAF